MCRVVLQKFQTIIASYQATIGDNSNMLSEILEKSDFFGRISIEVHFLVHDFAINCQIEDFVLLSCSNFIFGGSFNFRVKLNLTGASKL